MILKRIYEEGLAQASYLVGCAEAGEAIVIDPNRDIRQYFEAAEAEGLRITAVTETHIHADYLSGSRELAKEAGAKLYLSDEGDADWKYGFANEPNVRLVKDGDAFRIGNLRFDVLHTPGHTPEHISFVLTDEAASSEPMGVFTGDFIFVGDVGRPDLLEKAANIRGTMEPGARKLYASIQRIKSYPCHLVVLPGHGAGSACGKSLGSVPMSSLGYEMFSNWALRSPSEGAFVESVLEGQPDPPTYFAMMKRLNKQGPPALGALRTPPRQEPERLDGALETGFVVDLRIPEESSQGFVPGALNVPVAWKSFTNWCGWLLDYERPIYLIANDERQALMGAKRLSLIGLDRVEGWFGPEALVRFGESHGGLGKFGSLDPSEFAGQLGSGQLRGLDVRSAAEYAEGHIAGLPNIPLGYLPNRVDELPRDKPVAVHCESGGRSIIAISVLAKAGFRDLYDVPEGIAGYVAAGFPVEAAQSSGAHPVGTP